MEKKLCVSSTYCMLYCLLVSKKTGITLIDVGHGFVCIKINLFLTHFRFRNKIHETWTL